MERISKLISLPLRNRLVYVFSSINQLVHIRNAPAIICYNQNRLIPQVTSFLTCTFSDCHMIPMPEESWKDDEAAQKLWTLSLKLADVKKPALQKS